MSILSDVFQQSAAAASIPAEALLHGWQRFRSGKRVVLELAVSGQDDARERAAVVRHLYRAAQDPSIVGVLVRVNGLPGRWASCQDIRMALHHVRDSGKQTVAWLRSPGTASYWLASACSTLCIVPTDDLNLLGLGTEMVFLGSALAKLGIQFDVVSAGEYKAAAEPVSRSYPTPANLQATTALLQDLQRQVLSDIAQDRRLAVDQVRDLVSNGPYRGDDAKEAGLIDHAVYADQFDTWFKEFFGEQTKLINFTHWARRDAAKMRTSMWGATDTVAVVYLQGPIMWDDSSTNFRIRAKTVAPLLRELRESDDVNAVVLNINSPGGTVVASDIIWHEVDELSKVKPVVACFEDVSASGGVYLSASATEIVARPGTITGSIGVVGGKPVFGEGLRRIGVHDHTISLLPNANLYSAFAKWTEPQKERIRRTMGRMYSDFVSRVASGRGMSSEELEPYCRGRVWTGSEAKVLSLIDRHGDLRVAINRAVELAHLSPDDVALVEYDGQPSRPWLARQLRSMFKEVVPGARVLQLAQKWIPSAIQEQAALILERPGESWALLPWWFSPR